ncbi:hypothetical protein L1987_74895 [Smallanthus sonchifolius]|uniref:Uncharacterized protein n=1 Tax=Smallanthus sonchifolius TaxID=185202 RepID=A0ACB9A471_9ASTR|nr:hypothetical protein L1987_74895 [Smallanthus sonchifolius]
MANNHGGSGSKFVSVNLNKLYGQPSHHNYPSHSGAYGVGTNRVRPGGHVTAGGGMVVLSRNRPLQKAMPKLSVPPPLNLPSLRKEYEKIDLSGAGGGVAGGAGSGSGSRPGSSGVGWTKPGNVALQEKEVSSEARISESMNHTDGVVTKVSGAYMPPSARFGHGDTASAHHSNVAPVEKAMVLRGEDFPSLRAALPSSTGPAQKQKEGSFQKVKQLVSEEPSSDIRNSSHFNSSAHIQSSNHIANGVNGSSEQSSRPSSVRVDHAQKQEDPLPLIWLNPRSDWADDERDTGHGFTGRSGRDQELPKSEVYWDRDFDVPRSSILPHKPPNNLSERRGQPIAKSFPSEALKVEPYREINSWRNSSVHKDRYTGPHAINEGKNVTGPDLLNNSKFMSSLRDNAHHGVVTENRDPAFVRRDTAQGRQRHWNHSIESPRYRNESYLGGKSPFSKSERSYLDDSRQKDFSSSVYDERDPFTGNLVGVVKKKKDLINQTDFHDPVRESFEAELERVQKMQEMERQRIAEEQERALEQARREDEERRRAIFEEDERRRRMEKEAKEAAWIAEQERLDAIRIGEEQKIARDEEKRRMLLEEERRKQAAKQKLLELEARMAAKRNAEIGKGGNSVGTGADDEVHVGGKDSDASMDSDIDNWEVSQRMVERITSASSDSSAMNRPFDRLNPWKREAFEVGSNSSFLLNDQENDHHSPRREASIGGRSFSRREFYGGGYMSSKSPHTDGFSHLGDRDNRCSSFGDGESYGRNRDTESEFHDNVGEKYDEVGWGQGYSRNSTRSYSEGLYTSAEFEKSYSYGRSRNPMKQPCVLPPPSLSVPRLSVRGENEISAPSSSLESTARTGNYGGRQVNLQQSDLGDLQQGIMAEKLEKNDSLRCDSQSSLSVSSPPSSPTHLSHDELDDSGGGSVTLTGGEGKEVVNDEPGDLATMAKLKSVSTDEDEEWSLENHDEMQEQEEYDEDDGYGEEDEVHEGPDDNINLTQEFEHMQLEEKEKTNVMENIISGFDEDVEVRIPGDEFEKDLKTDGETNTADPPENSVGVVEKRAAVDALINEQPQNISKSTSSSLLGDPSAQQKVSSTVEIASNCTSGLSTTPVKLQFGLFSGPTLIPSPVHYIQIGSIQMPLHLHPPVGSSMIHTHQSQPPPLFQFGQLRYTSPVSQGILQHFNVNHSSATFLPYQFSQESSPVKMKNNSSSATQLINQNNISLASDNRIPSKPVTQTEEKGHDTTNNDSASSQGLSGDKNVPLSKAPGPSNRGERTGYPARNSGPTSFQAYDSMGSSEFKRKHRRPTQRTKFRVRENANNMGLDDKLNNKGIVNSTRNGYNRRQKGSTMSLKQVVHEGEIVSESRPEKETAKTKNHVTSSSVDNIKSNNPEEDVDAPLQSGVVHVFKQPGIECPSDEDDFIEVRSKRQMLNDRREQREKEIKAKSRVKKQPRKATSTISNKIPASLVGEASNNTRSDVSGLIKRERPAEFSTMDSQLLASIHTPAVDTDVQTGIRSHINKTIQSGAASAISGTAEDHGSNIMFETENKVVDDVQTSLGDWGNAQMDQQGIPLTQTQLDEAMKPARFNTTHITSIGDHTTLVSEPVLPSSSILSKGNSTSSSSSPIKSLLAGEKIQFGAVTSPTILPPSSRVVSHGVGAPGSFRPDMPHIAQSSLKSETDCNIFFKKDEQSTEDGVAEVEAAVSAVDVAAIDTIIGNGLVPVSVSVPKGFGGAVEAIQGGSAGDQQSGSQFKPEESLSVSLPADLSVENPPISLWTPLPSPQGSSTQMLSHFHGPTPSHFPFYDMNHPMMSGPVFAFGPHDESDGHKSQSHKPAGSNSRHIGAWQNHSGMDSFYGPAGFTGPFLGSPGGIPGVQAPPHMVVYNHYAPVGQFGQVGLSFMGATYIPSGKQPDWKHDPTSSRGEEDMSSMNMGSGPRNPPNMQQPPIQHLGPGSPLLPMGSPLTMFDVPPFQTAPDMAVQARWSHVPAPPLHAVPMSLHPVDQATFPPNRLSEPQASTPSAVFPVRNSTITHFPDELGLVDSSGLSISTVSAPVAVSHISSGTTKTGDGAQRGGSGISVNNKNGGSGVEYKNQHQQGKNHGGGYGYQRGGDTTNPWGRTKAFHLQPK